MEKAIEKFCGIKGRAHSSVQRVIKLYISTRSILPTLREGRPCRLTKGETRK